MTRTNECCVCIREASDKYHKITDSYANSQKTTILDILKKLNLIIYEITVYDNEIICDTCRKIIVDFYNYKLMVENQQNSHKYCVKKCESDSDNDQIKHVLESNFYEILKNFIFKNPRSSVFVDDQNQLVIKPLCSNIKNESVQEPLSFIDFRNSEFVVKTEDSEHEDADEQYDSVYDIGHPDEINNTANIDDDDYDSSEYVDCKASKINNEDSIDEDDDDDYAESSEGVKKMVLDNIEFISRTPECLIDSMKKKTEGPSSKSKYRNPENWIRIKQRTARAKGESYRSRSGKFIRARNMKGPCTSCRYKCYEKIPESDRMKNFATYWDLADFIFQKKFLFEHRIVEPVARRRARQQNPRNRTYSTKYFLDTFNDDGSIKEKLKVCETMFTNTLDICKNTIRTLQKKVVTGKVEDLRGQQRRKLSPGHVAAIEHIKKFPYFHIEKPMPLTQMYKMYVQECLEKKIDAVKDGTYRKLFSDNNECEFLRQHNKFKCTTCDEYNQANEYEKISLEMNYQHHLSNSMKCKQRARWRKSGKLKAEKKKLQREQRMCSEDQQQIQAVTSSQNFQPEIEFI